MWFSDLYSALTSAAAKPSLEDCPGPFQCLCAWVMYIVWRMKMNDNVVYTRMTCEWEYYEVGVTSRQNIKR